jgi:hypothetical protein
MGAASLLLTILDHLFVGWEELCNCAICVLECASKQGSKRFCVQNTLADIGWAARFMNRCAGCRWKSLKIAEASRRKCNEIHDAYDPLSNRVAPRVHRDLNDLEIRST